MPNLKGSSLLAGLDTAGDDAGVFGIAYSILTLGGALKGAGFSFSALKKVAGKLVEDGHATTFMIDKTNRMFSMTGFGDDGWVFYGGKLDDHDWARTTQSANTDAYYTPIDSSQISKYWGLKDELLTKNVEYSEWRPNLGAQRFENCISSSHYVAYRMGLGSQAASMGAWIPSVSNWMTWAATATSAWKHKRFSACNTHLPEGGEALEFETV